MNKQKNKKKSFDGKIFKILLAFNCIQILLIILLLIHICNIGKTPINTVIDVDNDSKKMENYVFLGDSITECYPVYDFFTSETPIINSGFSGFKTRDLLNDMNTTVYRYNPSKVFIEIGTNDLNDEDLDKEEIYDNIIKIVDNIQANRPCAKIYIESIYPINRGDDEKIDLAMVGNRKNEDIIEINERLKKYCENNNINYIDVYSELADEDGNLKLEYTKEGLHLSQEGYSVVSNILKKYITE